MNPDRSRPDAADRLPAARPAAAGRLRRLGRCTCGAPPGWARRLPRESWRTVLSGLIWLGLCGAGVVTKEMTDAALRWCDDLGEPPLPCCTDALPEGFRPDGLPRV